MSSIGTKQAGIPGELHHFDSLPDSAHVRLPVVAGLFAVSKATIWRRVRAGTLPAPKKLGVATCWQVRDLRRALA